VKPNAKKASPVKRRKSTRISALKGIAKRRQADDPVSKKMLQSKPKIKIKVQVKPKPKIKIKVQVKPKPKIKIKVQVKPKPKIEKKVSVKPEAKKTSPIKSTRSGTHQGIAKRRKARRATSNVRAAGLPS
jgi:hypothetical protein